MKKVLFKRKKGLLLHPQQRQRSFKYWQAIDTKEEKFSKKNIKKSLWEIKMLLTFAPRKTRKVPWKIDKKMRFKMEIKIFKKSFKFSCQLKKNYYFCTRFEKQRKAEKIKKNTFLDILNWQPSRSKDETNKIRVR